MGSMAWALASRLPFSSRAAYRWLECPAAAAAAAEWSSNSYGDTLQLWDRSRILNFSFQLKFFSIKNGRTKQNLPGQDVEDQRDGEVGGGHVDPDADGERGEEREQVRVLRRRFL